MRQARQAAARRAREEEFWRARREAELTRLLEHQLYREQQEKARADRMNTLSQLFGISDDELDCNHSNLHSSRLRSRSPRSRTPQLRHSVSTKLSENNVEGSGTVKVPILDGNEPKPETIPITTITTHESDTSTSSSGSGTNTPYTLERAASIIQAAWRRTLNRRMAIKDIGGIRSRFQSLQTIFKFPDHVDFDPAFEDKAALLYTTNNSPIHRYENDLIKFLTALDAIESSGSSLVRNERKALVDSIEMELRDLDQKKGQAWMKQKSAQAQPGMTETVESGNTEPLENVQPPIQVLQSTDDSPLVQDVARSHVDDVAMSELSTTEDAVIVNAVSIDEESSTSPSNTENVSDRSGVTYEIGEAEEDKEMREVEDTLTMPMLPETSSSVDEDGEPFVLL
ncbi:hypothetical protein FRC02_005775 [Tulasnella sp. 418]|nr:hypothetical protein FRC02_005775 [Tulasnella sp. 418]